MAKSYKHGQYLVNKKHDYKQISVDLTVIPAAIEFGIVHTQNDFKLSGSEYVIGHTGTDSGLGGSLGALAVRQGLLGGGSGQWRGSSGGGTLEGQELRLGNS